MKSFEKSVHFCGMTEKIGDNVICTFYMLNVCSEPQNELELAKASSWRIFKRRGKGVSEWSMVCVNGERAAYQKVAKVLERKVNGQ